VLAVEIAGEVPEHAGEAAAVVDRGAGLQGYKALHRASLAQPRGAVLIGLAQTV